ncbi:MAG TPA: RHS repeat-associated core domain-containing protein [Thermoanaerobaculia bacterium]|jgi:RHS repeat-associated protein
MRRILLLLLSIVVCAAAFAQQHPAAERGFRPELAYDFNGFDTVNLFNGNLIANVPIGKSYPLGAGLSYSFALYHSGQVWEEEEVCTVNCRIRYFPQRDNVGMGWRMSFGRLTAASSTAQAGTAASMWRYETPDGSEHFFYDTLHDPKCSSTVTTNCDPVVTGTRYTRDGSFLRMKEPFTTVRIIEYPNGERHRYVQYTTSTGSTQWRLDYIYNTFSNADWVGVPATNYVRFEYVPNALGVDDWKITDSHGRTHWVRFQLSVTGTTTTPLVDKVELAAFNGAVATYDLSYVSNSIKRPCENTTDTTASATVGFLSSIALPSGESWAFEYEQPTTACSNTSGTMWRATLPTLGRIEWSHQRYTYAATTVDSIGVSERRTYDLAGNQISRQTYNVAGGLTTVTVFAKRPSDGTWQADWKTNNYYVSGWGASFGLPFTSAAKAAPVPNPDGSTMGRYLSAETFDCDVNAGTCSTTADRASYVKFEMDMVSNCLLDYPCYRDRNRRMVSSRTLYVSDGSTYADVDRYSYDGLGHYRLIRSGGNFGVGDVKEVWTNYNGNTRNWSSSTWSGSSTGNYILDSSGNRQSGYTMLNAADSWVLGTFSDYYVLEGGVQAKTNTCFDPRNGFLHRKRNLAGTSAGVNDLVAVLTPDANGNIGREEYFGGDKQTVSTSSLCTMALPAHDQYSYRIDHTYSYGTHATARYADAAGNPVPFFSMRNEIDQSTGLIKRVYDTADLATQQYYDTSGRLTYTQPVYTSGATRVGSTSYDYVNATGATSPAKVNVREWMDGGAFDLTLSTYTYDGHGRLWREQTMLPNGANSTREMLYDHNGRQASVSEWMNTASPSNKTVYTYDLYGRVTNVLPPDGSAHARSYSYLGVRVINTYFNVATSKDSFGNPIESAQQSTQFYDRQGRLWRVVERPDGPTTGGILTDYTYNWMGKIAKVCHNASGTTCGQTRLYNYDRRGLLTSEQAPERGLHGNGTLSYTYDARGHRVRKLEGTTYGTFDLTYAFDRAERLTEVRQTPDPAAPVTKILKEISYDSATGWGKGKVWQAKRHNHDRLANDVVVTETYTYSGREGMVSRRDTCIGSSACTGASDKKFNVQFSYQDQGLPTSVTYPDCTAPAGCNSADTSWARTLNFSYANNMLTSVWQSGVTWGSLTYHDNAMPNTITHSNGMKSIEALDPNYMQRPRSFTAQYGTNPAMWSTGIYQYDGVGNIKKMGSDYFLYDGINRIKEGTSDYVSATNQFKHRFAYDAYGNQTNKYTSMNGGAETDNIWYINSSANRMSSPWPTQYDEAGNMTVWNNGSTTWTYDGLGAIRSSHTWTGDLLFFYTADEERIWTQNTTNSTGVWTIRDLGRRVLRQYNSSGPAGFETFSFAKDYLYRGGVVLASVTPSGSFHFHLDHLGNTRLITNASGVEVSRHKFFPFGEERSIYSTNAERKKFTGHERDYNGGTGSENVEYIDYMHARYYSPVWGRFLAVDPIDGYAANPQSFNRYSYARNNPLKYTDPSGLDECPRGTEGISCFTFTYDFDWEGFNDFLAWSNFFFSGMANAWASDNLLGIGRVEMNNSTYQQGQLAGDLLAMGTGLMEMLYGTGQASAGLVAEAVPGAQVPATAAVLTGAGIAAHGGTTTAVGAWHAMSKLDKNSATAQGRSAATSGGRAGSTGLRSLAQKLGLTVKPGGNHWSVYDKNGNFVTQIPHTLKSAHTGMQIVKDMVSAAF